MSSLSRSQSGHHMSHLPLEEANIVVTEQDLQRQIRNLYRLVETGAEEQVVREQRRVVRATELVLRRLKEASAQS